MFAFDNVLGRFITSPVLAWLDTVQVTLTLLPTHSTTPSMFAAPATGLESLTSGNQQLLLAVYIVPAASGATLLFLPFIKCAPLGNTTLICQS